MFAALFGEALFSLRKQNDVLVLFVHNIQIASRVIFTTFVWGYVYVKSVFFHHQSIHPPIHTATHQFIHSSIHLSIRLFIQAFIQPAAIHPSIHPSIQ
jgi:hypothetical protein